ncbi:MAG: PD-(D/E)XK nuclease family transposase, partial [Vallitaleaceae bacterium]|nr:PD-(D/E)XK nuclease family transposase [Vallitaleaceae bacterium]
YYGAKLHGEQLYQGEVYDVLKKTISIAIVSNIVIPETKKAHAVFLLQEKTEHFCFIDDLEIHCVHLPYIDDIMDIDEMDELTALMILIKDIHLPQKQELIK